MTKKWVNTAVAAGKLGNPANIMPGKQYSFAIAFEVAAADADGDVYYLAQLAANAIPLSLKLNCDAITGATSYDMGLYRMDGTVKDKDCFMAATDINAGAAIGSEIECLSAIGVDAIGAKKVYEFAGDSLASKDEAYILAITANTVGTAAGTIAVRGTFIQG